MAAFQSPYSVWVRHVHHWLAKLGLLLGWLLLFYAMGMNTSYEINKVRKKKSVICLSLALHIKEGLAEEHRTLSYKKTVLCNLSSVVFANTTLRVATVTVERPSNLLCHMNPPLLQD